MVVLRENKTLCCIIALIVIVTTFILWTPCETLISGTATHTHVNEEFSGNPSARFYCVRILAKNGATYRACLPTVEANGNQYIPLTSPRTLADASNSSPTLQICQGQMELPGTQCFEATGGDPFQMDAVSQHYPDDWIYQYYPANWDVPPGYVGYADCNWWEDCGDDWWGGYYGDYPVYSYPGWAGGSPGWGWMEGGSYPIGDNIIFNEYGYRKPHGHRHHRGGRGRGRGGRGRGGRGRGGGGGRGGGRGRGRGRGGGRGAMMGGRGGRRGRSPGQRRGRSPGRMGGRSPGRMGGRSPGRMGGRSPGRRAGGGRRRR